MSPARADLKLAGLCLPQPAALCQQATQYFTRSMAVGYQKPKDDPSLPLWKRAQIREEAWAKTQKGWLTREQYAEKKDAKRKKRGRK